MSSSKKNRALRADSITNRGSSEKSKDMKTTMTDVFILPIKDCDS